MIFVKLEMLSMDISVKSNLTIV